MANQQVIAHMKSGLPRMSGAGVSEERGLLRKFTHRVDVYEDTQLPYESTIDFD
jgi:hypothetical protein